MLKRHDILKKFNDYSTALVLGILLKSKLKYFLEPNTQIKSIRG